MNKYCSKCGKELKKDAKFCANCGTETDNTNKQNSKTNSGLEPVIENKNIGLAIVLTLVTCGIYGIIWMVSINDDTNIVSEDENGTSGALVFLFSLLTCGIYGIYWNYKMGQKIYEAGSKHGKNINDNSIVYLILSLCGLSIVSYCLMQNDLNQFS